MLPDMKGFFAALVLFGVGVGLLLAFGLPWLWGLVKPLLHAWTA